MKHFSIKSIIAGTLAGILLLSACGSNAPVAQAATSATEATTAAIDPDAPPLYPIAMGEAPISTISAPEYPDAIRASIILQDTTAKAYYDLEDYLSLDGFLVQSGHNYQLFVQMHSDGDDIKDIEFTVSEPEYTSDGSLVTLWFTASNRTTTQPLMVARIFLITADGAPDLGLPDAAVKLCEDGVYLGDIGNVPIAVVYGFSVL